MDWNTFHQSELPTPSRQSAPRAPVERAWGARAGRAAIALSNYACMERAQNSLQAPLRSNL